ncbi:MAG: hypothetical protein AAFV07_17215 [Bacteroidota bacterium]
MKNTFKLSILILAFFSISGIKAQTVNWNALNHTKHLISLGIGWDYAVAYNLGYAYKLQTKFPVLLHANVSAPAGNKLLDEVKIKTGGQILLIDQQRIKGGISLHAIYRSYQNPLIRLRNFGSEIKGTIGYFAPKWFVAGEIGHDKAIVTRFSPTDVFRESMYQDTQVGWYDPATGGHVLFGLQTGYSREKFDVTFSIGRVVQEHFTATPLIPYYVGLTGNYKIK